MALVWPDQKVAMVIVDDPLADPFEGDDSWTVVNVTLDEVADFESFDKIMKHVAHLLGADEQSGYFDELDLYEDKRRQLHDELYNSDYMRSYTAWAHSLTDVGAPVADEPAPCRASA